MQNGEVSLTPFWVETVLNLPERLDNACPAGAASDQDGRNSCVTWFKQQPQSPYCESGMRCREQKGAGRAGSAERFLLSWRCLSDPKTKTKVTAEKLGAQKCMNLQVKGTPIRVNKAKGKLPWGTFLGLGTSQRDLRAGESTRRTAILQNALTQHQYGCLGVACGLHEIPWPVSMLTGHTI